MGTVIHPSYTKDGLKNIGRMMNMILDTKKSLLGSQQCLRFFIWFIMTLSYKMRPTLLQNAKKFYYKMGLIFHSKVQQFDEQSLKNTLVLLENVTILTK